MYVFEKAKRKKYVFFIYSKLAPKEFKSLKSFDIPNAVRTGFDVPGLYLFENFISP